LSFTRFKSLSPIERQAILPALMRLLVARAVLTLGIQKASKWLGGQIRPSGRNYDSQLWAARARVLHGLSARIPGVACLAHSLALRWWMRSQGHDARMVIGVCKTSGKLESHAWVQVGEQIMIEKEVNIARFRVINHY